MLSPRARSDPFGLGLGAYREGLPRSRCPFPAKHDEAKRWIAGWEHAAFCATEQR